MTQGAQQLADHETVNLFYSALWGLGRVAALEHPEQWGGLIDLEQGIAPQEAARLLLGELLAFDGETQCAWRRGSRYVARLQRSAVPSLSSARSKIQPGAAYFVTGGLGALGLQVAEWLVEQGATRLLLSGRRGITLPSQQQRIGRLEALGVQVTVASVDVTDGVELAQLLDQVWGDHVFVEERTVDVHIRRLRKALESTGHDRLIETVRGSGYRFSR